MKRARIRRRNPRAAAAAAVMMQRTKPTGRAPCRPTTRQPHFRCFRTPRAQLREVPAVARRKRTLSTDYRKVDAALSNRQHSRHYVRAGSRERACFAAVAGRACVVRGSAATQRGAVRWQQQEGGTRLFASSTTREKTRRGGRRFSRRASDALRATVDRGDYQIERAAHYTAARVVATPAPRSD